MPARSIAQPFTRRQLLDAYRHLKQEECDKRAHEREVRETAWYLFNPTRPYTWRWWRYGFRHVYGARVERHDLTVIPGYDTFAQEMGTLFPEFKEDAEKLWDLLLSPYVPMPSRAELLRRAEERLTQATRKRRGTIDFDFGANTKPTEH